MPKPKAKRRRPNPLIQQLLNIITCTNEHAVNFKKRKLKPVQLINCHVGAEGATPGGQLYEPSWDVAANCMLCVVGRGETGDLTRAQVRALRNAGAKVTTLVLGCCILPGGKVPNTEKQDCLDQGGSWRSGSCPPWGKK